MAAIGVIGQLYLAATCSIVAAGGVVEHPALFHPATRAVCVELFVDEAEAMNLRVVSGGQPSFNLPHAWDTTSAVWLDDHRLMYATSELYGDGGIYLFDFKSLAVAQVVPADEADPRLFSWAKLISVNHESLTCWIAAVNGLDEGDLQHTASKVTFRWKTRVVPPKSLEEPAA